MATEIGSLLIDLRADVARLSQDMAKAQSTVEGAMAKVKSSAAAAVTALGLIGVGVSVAGMANVVKGAVGAMAALDDMAAKAGTTVENMSALADVAKIGGHDLSVVEGAMVRLSKALAGGDEEAKGVGHALAALGLSAEKLRSMDTAEALLLVAQALDQYGSGSGKTALAIDLLGKSGAAALPYLEDLAETGRLNASVTGEQAAAAEKLEKDINAVKLEGDKMTRAMVANMLPTMGDIAKAMRLAAEEGGTLKALFVGFGGVGAQVLNPLVALFKQLGASMHETAAEFNEWMAKFATGDVKQNLLKTAIQEREAAKRIYAEMTGLSATGVAGGSPSGKKPDLDYESKGSKDPKNKKSHFDPEGDFDLKFAQMQERYRKAGYDERDAAAKAEADAIEKLRQKYVAMADPLQQYRVQLDEINMLREKGLLTADQALEAEWAVNEAMDKTIDKMNEVGDAGKGVFADLKAAVESWGNKAADTFADFVVDGKASFSDLVNSMLKDIVRLQAKQMLDPVTKGASGFLSKIFGNLFGGVSDSPVLHGGGIVGQEQAGFRALSPLAFAAAPRFHSGGIAGDEVPAVLKRGEGVFTPGQMAALGGGGAGVTVVQHLNFAVGVSQTVRAEVMNLMPQIQAAAQGAVMDARLRGGSTRAAFRG